MRALPQRRWRIAILVTLSMAVAAALAAQPAGSVPPGGQDRPAPMRVDVDVIPVDVQVIDRAGQPVAGLAADAFEVTINGRRRRVVSVDLVGDGGARQPAGPGPAASAVPVTAAARSAIAAPGRVMVLAVDCVSFGTGLTREVMAAARGLIARLQPEDRIGLFAYPIGPRLDPTTDHAAVSRALDQVIGQREPLVTGRRIPLRPSELIDISAELAQRSLLDDSPMRTPAAVRECAGLADDQLKDCTIRLIQDINVMSLYYEAQAAASLGTLRALLTEMANVTGRKTVVLLSAGMVASDRPGGRPDVNDLGAQVGREAALANTAIYALQIEESIADRNVASTQLAAEGQENMSRDSALLGGWLQQFTDAAGGAMVRVLAGRGEAAYGRIIDETASYYLLGIEPAEADRDGRTHDIKVKVNRRNVTVRSRKWVALPKRGARLAAAPASPAPDAATPAPSFAAPRPPAPLPADVQPLTDAFSRADYAGVQHGISAAKDLANLIRDFRLADSPWPDAPHRAAVFALELALAGLRSDNGYARTEGSRLLAEYNTRVRQPAGADSFECAWLWAQSAALEGLFRPEIAMMVTARAVARCPNEPRVHLADAVAAEQRWLRGNQPDAAATLEVSRRYAAAMAFPETEAEARVRAAWFDCRRGELRDALALLDGVSAPSPDRYVRYLSDLVRGQVLRGLDEPDAAAAAFRAALTTWPGAQSARVALMTLLVSQGDGREAARLAEAAQAVPDDQIDPWWTYWEGDARVYPSIIDRLRELSR